MTFRAACGAGGWRLCEELTPIRFSKALMRLIKLVRIRVLLETNKCIITTNLLVSKIKYIGIELDSESALKITLFWVQQDLGNFVSILEWDSSYI